MKMRKVKFLILIVAILIIVVIGLVFFIKYRTYDYIQIESTYTNDSTDNENYKYCLGGILRYSRDGVALLTDTGEEIWNQPCQIKNPIVEISENSVAVADKGGTGISVFEKKGLKGEIKTTRPIEKVSVSSQGIVSAILKDEKTPMVMCYDAMGNILVEHKVSLNNTGYPMDVALSSDGKTLLVSYINTEGSEIVTQVVYYYFGTGQTSQKGYEVQRQELRNTVVPSVAFLDKDTSVLVADNALIYYTGLKKPKQTARVQIKQEIQSVAYNDEMVALLVKKSNGSTYKLHIYNKNGKLLASADVEKEYTDMKVVDDRIIMLDGQMCSIFTKEGIHKYEGKTDEKIMEMYPISGLNKYMMINASGFHEVRLAK